MPRYIGGKVLLARLWLALPLLADPALCFTVNCACFVWSIIVLILTGWKLLRSGNHATAPEASAKTALSMEAQWFADAAAWLILFAMVCGLFRLTRPILAWHRQAVQNAARLLRNEGDRVPSRTIPKGESLTKRQTICPD